jgi:hypothetical protein
MNVRERIERGMSVEPLPWTEHAKNAAALIFVVGIGGWVAWIVLLFIARALGLS